MKVLNIYGVAGKRKVKWVRHVYCPVKDGQLVG